VEIKGEMIVSDAIACHAYIVWPGSLPSLCRALSERYSSNPSVQATYSRRAARVGWGAAMPAAAAQEARRALTATKNFMVADVYS